MIVHKVQHYAAECFVNPGDTVAAKYEGPPQEVATLPEFIPVACPSCNLLHVMIRVPADYFRDEPFSDE